jgi:DivIVA domain-containing protein
MDLSQQSITGHQFDLNRRGYDPDAVDAHLADIAAAVTQREHRVAELEAAVASLEAKVQDANESEEALRLTLKAAAHAKEELLAGAREQAKALETEATGKAQQILAEATGRAEELTANAEARGAAMEDGARERARQVARAALAESEALVTHIEELRTRLAVAEEAVAALRTETDPRIGNAKEALEAALEKAHESVDNPDVLEQLAAEASPVVISAPQEDATVHEQSWGAEAAEASTEAPAAAEPEGGGFSSDESPVEGTAETAPDEQAAEPQLEVVPEQAESSSDISDKVDRLLEELREVT